MLVFVASAAVAIVVVLVIVTVEGRCILVSYFLLVFSSCRFAHAWCFACGKQTMRHMLINVSKHRARPLPSSSNAGSTRVTRLGIAGRMMENGSGFFRKSKRWTPVQLSSSAIPISNGLDPHEHPNASIHTHTFLVRTPLAVIPLTPNVCSGSLNQKFSDRGHIIVYYIRTIMEGYQ